MARVNERGRVGETLVCIFSRRANAVARVNPMKKRVTIQGEQEEIFITLFQEKKSAKKKTNKNNCHVSYTF